jgi:hypothetical protein
MIYSCLGFVLSPWTAWHSMLTGPISVVPKQAVPPIWSSIRKRRKKYGVQIAACKLVSSVNTYMQHACHIYCHIGIPWHYHLILAATPYKRAYMKNGRMPNKAATRE